MEQDHRGVVVLVVVEVLGEEEEVVAGWGEQELEQVPAATAFALAVELPCLIR